MAKSSRKVKANQILKSEFLTDKYQHELQTSLKNSVPYSHLHLKNVFDEKFLKNVQQEAITNLTAEFKESDLFKVFQTVDLGNLDLNLKKVKKGLPSLIALREYIYSPDFRNIVSNITGVNDIIDRVDCSMNI